jgi:hypothetical protein
VASGAKKRHCEQNPQVVNGVTNHTSPKVQALIKSNFGQTNVRLEIQVESTTKVKLVVYTKPDRNRILANAKLVVNTKPD